MKFNFFGSLIRLVFWSLFLIAPIKMGLYYKDKSLFGFMFSFETLTVLSYSILWVLVNTFSSASKTFRNSFYLTHMYAVFYTTVKIILTPKITASLFGLNLFCVFLGLCLRAPSTLTIGIIGAVSIYLLKAYYISPFMAFFLLPLAYFVINSLTYLYGNGLKQYLLFLFPLKLSDEERKAREKQLNWLSFVRNNKLFNDEYYDMDVSGVELRNVKTAKSKSLREDSLFQSQDADLLARALTHINRRDGGFSFDEFVKRATQVFQKVHNALYTKDIASVEHLLSDSLAQQLAAKIDEDTKRAAQPVSIELVINDIRIAQVNNDKNFDVLHLFVRAVSYDYIPGIGEKNVVVEAVKKANKKLVERNYTEYYTFIRKPSAKTKKQAGLLEGQCPSCGTPLQIGQTTRCPSCSSFIRSGAYDWVLSKITPAASWHYTEPGAISGYAELLKLDEDFSLQQIEERAGTTYWMLRKAADAKSPKPLMHYVYNAFITQFYEAIRSERLNSFVLDDVTYESSYLKAVNMDDKRVYCYCLSQTHRQKPVKKGEKSYRLVYVFARNKTGKTKKHDALSSIHCSNCGAALASSNEINCSYCNTSVNDDGTWLLEKVITELDREFMQVCMQNRDRAIELKVKAREEALSVGVGMSQSAREVIMVSAQILMADGTIDPKEKQLLTSIGAKYGINAVEMDEILDAISQGLVYVPKPDSQSPLALETLRVAAKMALADGVVTDDEIDAIANLGLQMGYTKIDVMQIINSEKTALKRQQARDSMQIL